jgi:hypothetical protein
MTDRFIVIREYVNEITVVSYFFLFNYVPHPFLLTCVKFHGKKTDNNNTLTHICLLPFFQIQGFRLASVI